MTQDTLFSAAAGIAARDDGIARVDENADEVWKADAFEAVRRVASVKATFTPDDIWKSGLRKPREPRALGPVMLRAIRAGLCERTDKLVPSSNPKQHRNMIRVYRSLLVEQPPPVSTAIQLLKRWLERAELYGFDLEVIRDTETYLRSEGAR